MPESLFVRTLKAITTPVSRFVRGIGDAFGEALEDLVVNVQYYRRSLRSYFRSLPEKPARRAKQKKIKKLLNESQALFDKIGLPVRTSHRDIENKPGPYEAILEITKLLGNELENKEAVQRLWSAVLHNPEVNEDAGFDDEYPSDKYPDIKQTLVEPLTTLKRFFTPEDLYQIMTPNDRKLRLSYFLPELAEIMQKIEEAELDEPIDIRGLISRNLSYEKKLEISKAILIIVEAGQLKRLTEPGVTEALMRAESPSQFAQDHILIQQQPPRSMPPKKTVLYKQPDTQTQADNLTVKKGEESQEKEAPTPPPAVLFSNESSPAASAHTAQNAPAAETPASTQKDTSKEGEDTPKEGGPKP